MCEPQYVINLHPVELLFLGTSFNKVTVKIGCKWKVLGVSAGYQHLELECRSFSAEIPWEAFDHGFRKFDETKLN